MRCLRCGIIHGVKADMSGRMLSEIGEAAIISGIRGMNGCDAGRNGVLAGIGDDCAVVQPEAAEDLVLKVDPVIMGRHFSAGDSPYDVGRKAMGRVLSDIASMGARPRWHLVGLAAPPHTDGGYIDGIYEGVASMAGKYGSVLVGGDTSCSDVISINVFGCGALPHGAARLRSGAEPGDTIYVTGELGGSFASGRHLRFEPRVREGIWLRDRANAMTDVSDGLAADLWHIAEESDVNAFIAASLIPYSPAALGAPDPAAAAFFDGEDFELLFTVPASDANFNSDWKSAFPDLRCTPIGVIGEKSGNPFVKYSPADDSGAHPRALPKRGFDHFRTDKEEP